MKPILLKITSGPAVSFSARADDKSYKNNNWHYHPEFELIHVVKGAGTLFAGDGIHHFKAGDLVFIGSFLPHYWKFDPPYTASSPVKSYIELTQFREDFWGKGFLAIPENQKIVTLLEKSKKGMVFRGSKTTPAKNLLTELIAASDTKRIVFLLELLISLADFKKSVFISSAYHSDNVFTQSERINKIYNYTLHHFRTTIYIKDVAKLANLTTNSFCRYFKSCTRKSYTQFIAELRIGHACKLLSEGRMSIKETCYESGFNNITYFNRLFKKLKGMQPAEYRKMINT